MKKVNKVKLLNYIKKIGIEYIDLEFLEMRDTWAEVIVNCNNKKRIEEIMNFATYTNSLMNMPYMVAQKPYNDSEINKICEIKYLSVVEDLLTSGMISRIPNDEIIQAINSSFSKYQANCAALVLCNPELQKFGIAKSGAKIILESKTDFQMKYVLLALYNCSVAIALEGSRIINKSETEYQARGILDILCNQKMVELEIALEIAEKINRVATEYQIEFIKKIIGDVKNLDSTIILEEIEQVIQSESNHDGLKIYINNKSKQKVLVNDAIYNLNI